MKTALHYLYIYRHLLSLVLLTFIAGFLFAWLFWCKPMHAQQQQLQDGLYVSERKREQLLRDIAGREVDNSVLRNSKMMLRRELEAQKNSYVEQEKQLDFFRQLMVSDSERSGLDLNDYSLMALSEPGTYLYRFTFVQYAQNHDRLKASLSIAVYGNQGDEEKDYQLHELLFDGDTLGDLDFKFFQVIEGRLRLPEDFAPQGLVLRAVRDGRNASPWERELEWQTKE